MSATQTDEDPFEFFDRHTGAGAVRDPYPGWAEIRARTPVVEEGGVFTALSYDAVDTVLKDGETFSSKAYGDLMGLVMGHSILEMDDPEHRMYRGLVQQAFTRKAMQRWEAELVEPIVDGYLDQIVPAGGGDLVRGLLFPFPVHVIAGLLGLPEGDLPKFHRWAVELISVGFDWDRGIAASHALRDYFGEQLASRQAEGATGDDVISVLARAELDGQTLTPEEIFAFLRLLLPAGAETTYRSSSNLMFGLLTNPDQLAALTADRSLLPQAIEEGLRWEPPLTGILRTSTRDVEVCGVPIPAGAPIGVNLGAANRDPARWDEPDRFDLFRPQKPHIAFASGPHMCLGLHLARMETTVVINRILDRLPNLRLDPAAEDVHITGEVFRAPRSLPVVFG